MTTTARVTLYAIIEAALAAQVEKRKTPPVEAPAGRVAWRSETCVRQARITA